MASEDFTSQKEALKQYELQLEHINDLITNSDRESLVGLNSLKSKLLELIDLTKENIASLEPTKSDNQIDNEYALFMSEIQNGTSINAVGSESQESENIGNTENEGNENVDAEDSIWEELNCLIGTKCQAPYSEEWTSSDSTYHNALIMNIDTIDDDETLKVKVMFINPISRKMIPCSYFLDGDCKFSDEQCRFSHGYVVNFSDLKEYKDPDFNLINENAPVLARDNDNLWKRAIVTGLIPEENKCSVQFESGSKRMTVVDIQNTLPLFKTEIDYQENNIQNDASEDLKQPISQEEHDNLVEKSLTQEPASVKLGEWEKYTKSIGSKLMANMGYVVGTGLGKRGDGRLEPVVAQVLPAGKSLDHCMQLREAAGGDPNLFKVDKFQKKLRNKIIARNAKRQKQIRQETNKRQNMFNIINDSIAGSSKETEYSVQNETTLKSSSAQQLNVEELRVSESIDKKKYELYVLQDTLTRQKKNTVGFNSVSKKLKQAQKELYSLQNKLKDVNNEQSYRKTIKELSKF